jgi:hypothetical protein
MEQYKVGEILIDFDGEDGSLVYRLTKPYNEDFLKESNKDLYERLIANVDDLHSIIYDLLNREVKNND